MSPRHTLFCAALIALTSQAFSQTAQIPTDELRRLQERTAKTELTKHRPSTNKAVSVLDTQAG
jgi:hypothetical protein